jgi:hypothetical protein
MTRKVLRTGLRIQERREMLLKTDVVGRAGVVLCLKVPARSGFKVNPGPIRTCREQWPKREYDIEGDVVVVAVLCLRGADPTCQPEKAEAAEVEAVLCWPDAI